MKIAIDFDGTIVEHRYPEIGRERPMAIATLLQLQREGHQLILWSVRRGKLLQDAVEWCAERGLKFYAINANNPEDTLALNAASREPATEPCQKITVDLYVDDRNVGGLPHWSIIYQLIHKRCTLEDYLRTQSSDEQKPTRKKHWWSR